jgi:hypothetical protein
MCFYTARGLRSMHRKNENNALPGLPVALLDPHHDAAQRHHRLHIDLWGRPCTVDDQCARWRGLNPGPGPRCRQGKGAAGSGHWQLPVKHNAQTWHQQQALAVPVVVQRTPVEVGETMHTWPGVRLHTHRKATGKKSGEPTSSAGSRRPA